MTSVTSNSDTPQPVRTALVSQGRDLRLFMVAGEQSGDALGAKLMAALNRRLAGRVRYLGVGGPLMEKQGLISQFPLDEVAVMGPLSILSRLPRILQRISDTTRAGLAAEADAVVIIDSPEFTHPIARRIRRRRPSLPIIDYVSPSVWAWRPGRARRMRKYIDHVLALLPFEPEVHERLGGPACTFVGHPLSERVDWIAGVDPKPLIPRLGLDPEKPVLVVLPGSRASEVSRLLPPFSGAVARLAEDVPGLQIIVPVVPAVRSVIEAAVAHWPAPVHLIEGEDDKFMAFRLATAALAASGTVTLELAIAGTPAVVAYKVDALAAQFSFLLKVPSIALANLVAGVNIYPECIQQDCTPEKLAAAVLPLLGDSEERRTQEQRLERIGPILAGDGAKPSDIAAGIVLRYAEHGRKVQ